MKTTLNEKIKKPRKQRELKPLSPLEKKKLEINLLIKDFTIDEIDVEMLNKKTPVQWENYAKKNKYTSFNLTSVKDDVGYRAEFTLTVQNVISTEHNYQYQFVVMARNNKKNEIYYLSLKEWENHVKSIAKYTLTDPKVILSNLLRTC